MVDTVLVRLIRAAPEISSIDAVERSNVIQRISAFTDRVGKRNHVKVQINGNPYPCAHIAGANFSSGFNVRVGQGHSPVF